VDFFVAISARHLSNQVLRNFDATPAKTTAFILFSLKYELRSRKSSSEKSSSCLLSRVIACSQTSVVVIVMPAEEAKALVIPLIVCDTFFIASALSICAVKATEGPRMCFRDVSEAAPLATDSEPEIALALHFPGPRLTLVKIDEELEPWSEGARNEEGVEGGAEMSVVDFAVGVGLEAKASWQDAVGV